MSEICFTCSKSHSSSMKASGSLKAKISLANCINIRVLSSSSIKAFTSNIVPNKSTISSTAKVIAKNNFSYNAKSLKDNGIGQIRGFTKVNHNLKTNIQAIGQINNIHADKFSCTFSNLDKINNFQATEKLYPIKDLITSYNNNYFVDKYVNSGNLYANIDEGVFAGNYTKHGSSGTLISDERLTYIQPSSVFTKGDFKYKCEISRPLSNAKSSFLCIRAAAPVSDYASDIPPQYKIYNIRLEDPSGNLIIKYKDILLRGDADYSTNYQNFTTYISEPEVNNLNLHTWDSNYPFMESASGYSLNLDFNIDCLDDPFSEGFNRGYEDTCKLEYVIGSGENNTYLALDGSPLSTQSQGFNLNPNNSIRISAIEIANSGSAGLVRDSYITFYSEVNSIGQRNIRNIFPVEVITSSTDLNIYPSSVSIWKSSPDSSGNYAYNTSVSGSKILTSRLQENFPSSYITLESLDPINDSGRLSLKFSHSPPKSISSYTEGAFSFGTENNAFDSAEMQVVSETDNYFVIDNIELKIIAKKAVSSRDYSIDVVGYSDDKLLNISSKRNAFLQNTETGSGNIPQTSGFLAIDDLGISTEPISDKNQYFADNLVTNPAGDHYKLSQLPLIDSTIFQEYTIPLTIYDDNVTIGKSIDYSVSPYFENLYLDLYPIPSGASISTAYLVITYKPSNALSLHTVGQTSDTELARRPLTLYPSQIQNSNCIINGYTNQLSVIENIPQSYHANSGIRSNYARRWRGVTGNSTYGPYNPDQFDFGFYNPQSNYPFNIGYYDFTNFNTNYFWQNNTFNISQSQYNLTKNEISAPAIVDNYGLRFNNVSLFNATTGHSSIDWTRISGYENDILYGKIADTFNRCIRVNSSNSYSFNDSSSSSLSGGFALFIRFSPDIDVSGTNYNFFNSGIIASKWSSGNQLEFIIAYDNGYISAYAQDNSGNIIQIKDTKPYSEYQYPLPILLTYNDNDSYKLRLYTDNELENNFNILRSSSSSFLINNPLTKSSIQIGTSASGISLPMFVTDLGLSLNSCNILSSGSISKIKKQITAQEVFDEIRMPYFNDESNVRYSLPLFIDENTSSWSIGDFRTTSFSPDFSFLTSRSGQDFIVHNLHHSGSGYSQYTNLPLPSNINLSGIAYHSQIENDFLRFSLSNVDNSFYSADRRIHKNVIRGYNFEEKSIYVDTIIEQDSASDIIWSDNSIGPKLIVSLYTKNQEPIDRPSKENWGLINRSIHQIEQSGGIHKISTTFNYNDIFDISEPWAKFDSETIYREFEHNYLSKDINDMFLQYDLVYPSGSPINSTIKIHSANVKLENTLRKEQGINNQFNLVASGEKYQFNSINLNTFGLEYAISPLNLYATSIATPIASSVLNLNCSGAYFLYNSLNTYCHNVGSINNNLPLYVGGRYNKFDDQILPLINFNTFTQPSTQETFNLFVNNRKPELNNEDINLYIRGRTQLINYFPSGMVNMFVAGEPYVINTNNNFNLYVDGSNPNIVLESAMNLYLTNYLAVNQEIDQQATLTWNGKP